VSYAVLALLVVSACDLDLERMTDQPRFTSYEACDVCPEGTIMMQPPPGTVPRGPQPSPPEVADGMGPHGYVTRVPVRIDARLLARGRNRFDIYCAACHGRLGNGVSQVAENMTLRKPPNLVAAPYTEYPPGRVYAVIARGFGLMRSYAPELPIVDRWAVVAYLQALQLSQSVPLAALPATRQQEARSWLK